LCDLSGRRGRTGRGRRGSRGRGTTVVRVLRGVTVDLVRLDDLMLGLARFRARLRTLYLHLEALVNGGRVFNGHLAGITGVTVDGVDAAHVHAGRLLGTGNHVRGTVRVTGAVRATTSTTVCVVSTVVTVSGTVGARRR